LQFLIHLLPVSSGFHFYTHAFRSLLRVLYALPIVHDTSSKNAKLSSANYDPRLLQSYFRDVTPTPVRITDITRSRMTCAGSHFMPRIRHSLPIKKVEKVEKVKHFRTIPTLGVKRLVQIFIYLLFIIFYIPWIIWGKPHSDIGIVNISRNTLYNMC